MCGWMALKSRGISRLSEKRIYVLVAIRTSVNANLPLTIGSSCIISSYADIMALVR